jgi:hypothetical protein
LEERIELENRGITVFIIVIYFYIREHCALVGNERYFCYVKILVQYIDGTFLHIKKINYMVYSQQVKVHVATKF